MKKEHLTGYVSEQTAALWFIKQGYLIYWPSCTQSPCDFIAAKEQELLRVQVKSAYWSLNHNKQEYLISTIRKGCKQQHSYSKEECDILCIVFENRIWIIPIEDIGNEMNITLDRKQPRLRVRNKDYSIYERH